MGKSSISMGHLYHGYVLNNQRVLKKSQQCPNICQVWTLLFPQENVACRSLFSQLKMAAEKRKIDLSETFTPWNAFGHFGRLISKMKWN